jgi:hypothetical protein
MKTMPALETRAGVMDANQKSSVAPTLNTRGEMLSEAAPNEGPET